MVGSDYYGQQATFYGGSAPHIGQNVPKWGFKPGFEPIFFAAWRGPTRERMVRIRAAAVGVPCCEYIALVARTSPGVLISIGRESMLLAMPRNKRPTDVCHKSLTPG